MTGPPWLRRSGTTAPAQTLPSGGTSPSTSSGEFFASHADSAAALSAGGAASGAASISNIPSVLGHALGATGLPAAAWWGGLDWQAMAITASTIFVAFGMIAVGWRGLKKTR